MATAVGGPGAMRHPFITWAAALSALNGVLGVLFAAAWPDLKDRGVVVAVSIVLGVLFLAAAWWLRGGSRRGAITLIVLNTANALLSIPGFFTGDAPNIIGGAVSLTLSVAAIVLLWMPAARAAWTGQG